MYREWQVNDNYILVGSNIFFLQKLPFAVNEKLHRKKTTLQSILISATDHPEVHKYVLISAVLPFLLVDVCANQDEWVKLAWHAVLAKDLQKCRMFNYVIFFLTTVKSVLFSSKVIKFVSCWMHWISKKLKKRQHFGICSHGFLTHIIIILIKRQAVHF